MSGAIVTTINTPVTGASGSNTPASDYPNLDGGPAPAVAVGAATPFSNQDFTGVTPLNGLVPEVTGGSGGAAGVGQLGTSSADFLNGTVDTYLDAGAGMGSGIGGAGGAASLTMGNDSVGTAGTTYTAGSFGLRAVVQAGAGGGGGAGGNGGSAGFDEAIQGAVVVGGQGGAGSPGGRAGIGGAGSLDVSGMVAFVQAIALVDLTSLGGAGGRGGNGGLGGDGGAAGPGATGGDGATGGAAAASFTGALAFSDTAFNVQLGAFGGVGGGGGEGGTGGTAQDATGPGSEITHITYSYGHNGGGGAGGNGGNAAVSVAGDTLTAPGVMLNLTAVGGLGQEGATGATHGTAAAGSTGASGVAGSGHITISGDSITVGSGIADQALETAVNQLTLQLETGTGSGPTVLTPVALDGGAGGNLTFAGNSFLGNGSSTLSLTLFGGGSVTIDTAAGTISIDGSPGNALSGFRSFNLDNNDIFVAGPGDYVVSYAFDPDTLVFTPQSGTVTLQNVNDANLRLLFRGFGAGLTADGVRAASALEGGSTVISLGAGEVVLQNYAATIPDGDITVQAACYGEGTRIATLRGEVPIERLRVGDQVVSVFGGSAPVRWIGWRALDLRRHPRPELAWPVRVRAGAFADGVPRRDLVMSADHAVYVDSVLIPVRTLVNGTTIRREPAAGVVWYHVELPMHDVILAEGLAAESYLDTGNRSAFANGGKAVALNPDFAREVWEAEACAAQVTQGARHARVVARLAARALDQGHRRNDQRTSSG